MTCAAWTTDSWLRFWFWWLVVCDLCCMDSRHLAEVLVLVAGGV